MRLVYKIMTGVLLVVAVLLAIHSYLVVKREIELFRADMDLHAYLLGSVLSSSVTDIWKTVSPARVQSIINDANHSENLVQVRLVWFDVPIDSPAAPRVKVENLTPLILGQEVIYRDYSYGGTDYHFAYFPVQLESNRLSALELTQPLAPMQQYIRTTVIHKIFLFIAFMLVGGGLLGWLGVRLVGRPVHALIEQTHAVGKGNLEAHNELENLNDEIGDLALGLNEMVRDLKLVRNQLEEEVSRRLTAIEQLNHAERLATVGKLASGLAHELGTPLNVVSGRAKMIAGENMDREELIDSAAVIQNQAERMTGIIRQLLDFARSSSLDRRRETLTRPIDNAVHLLGPIASQRGISLEIRPGENPPKVNIDIGQIQQVLSNLIINAIHAMPNGGTITIGNGRRLAKRPVDQGDAEGEYAFIDVIDTGTGIPKENLGRIFTPFFSTKQVGEGTGLGLSIAHGIITEHGGWLAVASTEGKGSTFSIYLPIGEEQ